MEHGLIHLYTGDGKGKTTAALGLALRAYGRGLRVVLVQFLKGSDTGELHALERLPGVAVLRNSRDFGFYPFAAPQDQTMMLAQNTANLSEGIGLAERGQCDLLILDEVCAAYTCGAVEPALVDGLLNNKPPELELVLTGRNPPDHFIRMADYVTECLKRKHPFDTGVLAREGVEF